MTSRGGAIGVAEGATPSRLKKGGGLEDVGFFQASKLLQLALLSSLMRKYMLWKGFYHDFST